MNKKCGKTAFISDYIEGNLPEKKKAEFEAHLNACPLCAVALKETREALEAVKSLKEAELPVNFYAKLNMKLDGLEENQYEIGEYLTQKAMLKEESNLCCESREPEPRKKFDFKRFFGRGALVFASVFTVLIAYNVIKQDEKEKMVVLESVSDAVESEQKSAPIDSVKKEKAAIKGDIAGKGGSAPLQVMSARPAMKRSEADKPRALAVELSEAAAPEPEPLYDIHVPDKNVFDFTAGKSASVGAAPAGASETDRKKSLESYTDKSDFYGMAGGSVTPHEAAVNSREEWDKLPKAAALEGINPDFSKYTALVVFAGEKNTAGYAVRFTSIKEEGNSITAEYRVGIPAAGAMTAQVITAPYAVKLISKTEKTIIFRNTGN